MKKYKLTNETMQFDNTILHRIEALRSFGDVQIGDKGGWVEDEINLAHDGLCWIYDDSKVFGYGNVSDNAKVANNSTVYGDAIISDNAEVQEYSDIYGMVSICDNAKVFGNSIIYDGAVICDNAEVGYTSKIFGDAKIAGNAKVQSETIFSGTIEY